MRKKTICDMCGQNLMTVDGVQEFISSQMDMGDAFIVCKNCIARSAEILGIHDNPHGIKMWNNSNSENTGEGGIFLPKDVKLYTPTYIYENLKEYVIGQDSFLNDVSCWAYEHLKRLSMIQEGVSEGKLPPKTNMWVIGPTGVGKTLTFTRLAKLLDIPLVIANMTSVTEAGYVGNDVEDVLRQLITAAGGNVARAMCGIIVLDEVDKLATKQTNGRDVSGEGVQQALLKIIEGNEYSEVSIPTKSNKQGIGGNSADISTQNIAFAACGAFVGLKTLINEKNATVGFRVKQGSEMDRDNIAYTIPNDDDLNEDLIKYGMIPELMGRFQMKSVLRPLNFENLKRIMIEPRNSIIKTEIGRFNAEGINLIVDDSVLDVWAKSTMKKKMGARGLATEISNTLKKGDIKLKYFGQNALAEVRVYIDSNGIIQITTKEKIRA